MPKMGIVAYATCCFEKRSIATHRDNEVGIELVIADEGCLFGNGNLQVINEVMEEYFVNE